MLLFGLENHQPYVFSSFETFKYVRRTLVHAFLPLTTLYVRGLLHCDLQKHHWYFAFAFMTTVDLIHSFFLGF